MALAFVYCGSDWRPQPEFVAWARGLPDGPLARGTVWLAERLLAEGETDEARQLLERSLEEHQYAPGFVRRRNRRWASHARRLQKQL